MAILRSGPSIFIGYPYTLRVELDETGLLPAGCALIAHVRSPRGAPTPLALLASPDDGLVRVSDTEIDITLSAEQTLAMSPGGVDIDVVRSDVIPHAHLGFILKIPTLLPVTRPWDVPA